MNGVYSKINDLSKSELKQRFLDQEYKPETNIAVAMGRVSTKGQKDRGRSDEAQIETINGYMKRERLILARPEWDVAETASKHEDRKNFIEMLDYVKTHPQVKHIVFSHQSRSNRNRESARELEWLVRNMGVTLHCARDGLKLNAHSPIEDWMRWDLFNCLNEKYIKDHTRNVMDGTIKRIENGLFPGKAPMGYKNFRPHENGESTFVIDEVTAPYVRRAFELFASGRYSIARLVQELENEFGGFHGRKPDRKYMEKLLKNPFYYGDFDYSGTRYRGSHPPLISFQLWEKAQKAFKQRGWKNKCTKVGLPYTGMMKCAGKILNEGGQETDQLCGCAITAEVQCKPQKDGSVKEHIYWRCSNTTLPCSQRNREHMKARNLRMNMRQDALEAQLEEILVPLKFTEEDCKWMQEVLLQHHRDESQKHSQKLSALHSRLKMLNTYIDSSYEDKLNGTITEALWREKNEDWRIERDKIKVELSSMEDQKQEYIERGVLLIELAQRTVSIYRNAKPEIKRKLIDSTVGISKGLF
ncbi:MAG: recombinase family protein [Bdellovibrionales bacterium]